MSILLQNKHIRKFNLQYNLLKKGVFSKVQLHSFLIWTQGLGERSVSRHAVFSQKLPVAAFEMENTNLSPKPRMEEPLGWPRRRWKDCTQLILNK